MLVWKQLCYGNMPLRFLTYIQNRLVWKGHYQCFCSFLGGLLYVPPTWHCTDVYNIYKHKPGYMQSKLFNFPRVDLNRSGKLVQDKAGWRRWGWPALSCFAAHSFKISRTSYDINFWNLFQLLSCVGAWFLYFWPSVPMSSYSTTTRLKQSSLTLQEAPSCA